jgi:hypothetical protein
LNGRSIGSGGIEMAMKGIMNSYKTSEKSGGI